jgi:hypothetical protein
MLRFVARTARRALSISLVAAGLVVGGTTSLHAQFARPVGDIAIYLVTAGPGSLPLTWFGHAALVVADGVRQRDDWYDYGIIDENLNPLLHELRGDVRARVIRSSSPRRYLAALERADRTVLVQELRLSRAERDTMIAAMTADVVRFGRDGYAYNHLTDNCTTRIRDVIDYAVGGALSRTGRFRVGSLTTRARGDRQLAARSTLIDVLADFITGRSIDRPMTVWEESYLPAALALAVASDTLADGKPLGVTRYEFVTRNHVVPERNAPFVWYMLAVGISLSIVVLLLARAAQSEPIRAPGTARAALAAIAACVTLTLGMLGVVIVGAMTLTHYTFLAANENIMLANPLTLALLPATVAFGRGSPWGERILRVGWLLSAAMALVAVVTKFLPGYHQDNWREIALVVPVVLSLAAAFFTRRDGMQRDSPERSQVDAHAV